MHAFVNAVDVNVLKSHQSLVPS